jgi:hypothetical protein
MSGGITYIRDFLSTLTSGTGIWLIIKYFTSRPTWKD